MSQYRLHIKLFLQGLFGALLIWSNFLTAHGQQHVEVTLAIPRQSYELSPSGRTLVLWKGDQSKINMGTDPVLSKIDTIGAYAFHALDSLGQMVADYTIEELILPPTLRAVEEGAFYCMALKKIYLNNRLEYLARAAFIDCALTEIYLPASLRLVASPFLRCMRLDRVEVAEDSPFLAIEKGALVNLDRKELLYYPTGAIYAQPLLPEEIVAIAPSAFANNPYIQKLIIPKGVRYIAQEAFAECPSLTTIELPSTIEALGENVWRYSPVDTLVMRSNFPPQFEGNPRFLVTRRPAHLYVPSTTLSLYAGDEFWKKHFATLESMDVLEEYFMQEGEDSLPFYLLDRMLYLTLPDGVREARLFDRDGILVKVLSHSGGHALLPGTYLLRIKDKTYKVICANQP